MSEQTDDLSKQETKPMQTTKRMQATERPDEDDSNAGDHHPQGSAGRTWPPGYLLLWLLTAISLIANTVLLRQVILARATAQRAVADSIAALESFQEQRFEHTIVIDDTIAIETDLPVNETIPVVVDQTLPVDTIVRVSVNAGPLGTIPLSIPIETDIPVYFEQDIEIDQAFAIQTAVPIHLEIPIAITTGDTGLDSAIDDLLERLKRLDSNLNQPLVPLNLPGD